MIGDKLNMSLDTNSRNAAGVELSENVSTSMSNTKTSGLLQCLMGNGSHSVPTRARKGENRK